MADDKKLHPPQWLGRPILDHEHVRDLETRAAINEFHHKIPRGDAEQQAHDSYVKENRERAAAHHLAGMKAAMATGNHQDARKHWAMYDLHLKALGKDSIGAVPPEIEKRMMDEHGQKPIYKFKAHKGDLYALHEPTKDVAPAEGTPIAKAEDEDTYHPGTDNPAWKGVKLCLKPIEGTGKKCNRNEGHKDHCGNGTPKGWKPPVKKSEGEKKPYGTCVGCNKEVPIMDDGKSVTHMNDRGSPCAQSGTPPWTKIADSKTVKKGEMGAKQCKWRLGERRCRRLVTSGYCHDHVDHWANKIKQADHDALEKAGMDAGNKPPPAGTAHLQAPAVAKPMHTAATAASGLHDTPEAFLVGLKKHPQGSLQRNQFIAQHMNHTPLANAFASHPDPKVQALWKPIVQMGMKFANSTANAGPHGPTKIIVKSEAQKSAEQLLKAVLELAKGTLIKFPGNPAPAVDQGQPASVAKLPVKPAEVPQGWTDAVNETIAAGPKDPGDYSHLVPAEHAQRYRLRVVRQDANSHVAQLLRPNGAVLGSLVGTPTGKMVQQPGALTPEPEIAWNNQVPALHQHMMPWMQMAIHQNWGSE